MNNFESDNMDMDITVWQKLPAELFDCLAEFLDAQTLASAWQTNHANFFRLFKQYIKQTAEKHGHTLSNSPELFFQGIDDTVGALIAFHAVLNENLSLLNYLDSIKWQERAKKIEALLGINTFSFADLQTYIDHCNPILLAELAICYNAIIPEQFHYLYLGAEELDSSLEGLSKGLLYAYAALISAQGKNLLASWLCVRVAESVENFMRFSNTVQDENILKKKAELIDFYESIKENLQNYKIQWLIDQEVTCDKNTTDILKKIFVAFKRDSLYGKSCSNYFYSGLWKKIRFLLKRFANEQLVQLSKEILRSLQDFKRTFIVDLLVSGEGYYKFVELHSLEKIIEFKSELSILCSAEALAFYNQGGETSNFTLPVLDILKETIFKFSPLIPADTIPKWLIELLKEKTSISLFEWKRGQITALKAPMCKVIPRLLMITSLKEWTIKDIKKLMKNDYLATAAVKLKDCPHHEVILEPFLKSLKILEEILNNATITSLLFKHKNIAEYLLKNFTTIDDLQKRCEKLLPVVKDLTAELFFIFDKYTVNEFVNLYVNNQTAFDQFLKLLLEYVKPLIVSNNKNGLKVVDFFQGIQSIIKRKDFIELLTQNVKNDIFIIQKYGWESCYALYLDKNLLRLQEVPASFIQALLAKCGNFVAFKQRLEKLNAIKFFTTLQSLPANFVHILIGHLHFQVEHASTDFTSSIINMEEIIKSDLLINIKTLFVNMQKRFDESLLHVGSKLLEHFYASFPNYEKLLGVLTSKISESRTFIEYLDEFNSFSEQSTLAGRLTGWIFNGNYLVPPPGINFNNKNFAFLLTLFDRFFSTTKFSTTALAALIAFGGVSQVKRLDEIIDKKNEKTISLLFALCRIDDNGESTLERLNLGFGAYPSYIQKCLKHPEGVFIDYWAEESLAASQSFRSALTFFNPIPSLPSTSPLNQIHSLYTQGLRLHAQYNKKEITAEVYWQQSRDIGEKISQLAQQNLTPLKRETENEETSRAKRQKIDNNKEQKDMVTEEKTTEPSVLQQF